MGVIPMLVMFKTVMIQPVPIINQPAPWKADVMFLKNALFMRFNFSE
jgi:hypothetical protein